MNNIKKAFENKKAFIGFLTAGDPTFDESVKNITALADGGADLIEVGIPFSDPIAEGAAVQESNIRAINNGMTVDRMFDLVEKVREKTSVPIILVSYLNPVFSYGYEEFFKNCARVGINGIICPDLPYEEQAEVKAPAESNGVALISVVEMSDKARMTEIAKKSVGFVYITSAGTDTAVVADAVNTLHECADIPAAVNVDMCDAETASSMLDSADGIIVSKALVELVAENKENTPERISNFVKKMKKSI